MAINEMEAIKFSLKRQNDQAEALVKVIERVEQIESNVNEKYEQTSEAVEEVTGMVHEVRNRVHLEEADANKIKSIVSKKAHEIAKEQYGDLREYGAEYLELVGYARRHVYKKLKTRFNVTKYTAIRHVDRDEAKEYTESIVLDHSFLMDYEQWRYQRIKKAEREKELIK